MRPSYACRTRYHHTDPTMSAIPQLAARRARNRLYVELATTIDDIRASQALRYQVFAEELGATVKGAEHGHDEDDYDPIASTCWCARVAAAGSWVDPPAARRAGAQGRGLLFRQRV